MYSVCHVAINTLVKVLTKFCRCKTNVLTLWTSAQQLRKSQPLH